MQGHQNENKHHLVYMHPDHYTLTCIHLVTQRNQYPITGWKGKQFIHNKSSKLCAFLGMNVRPAAGAIALLGGRSLVSALATHSLPFCASMHAHLPQTTLHTSTFKLSFDSESTAVRLFCAHFGLLKMFEVRPIYLRLFRTDVHRESTIRSELDHG